MTITPPQPHPNKIPSQELDVNIGILHALLRPGERLSSRRIAQAVGCSNTLIYLVEKKALRKVREQLRRRLKLDYGQFTQEKCGDFL